jgi:hypothetical protein
VAVGDYNGDGFNDIIVGTGKGTSPKVYVYSGATLFTRSVPSQVVLYAPGMPATATVTTGVRVKTYVVNGGDPGTIERVYLVAELVGKASAYYYSIRTSDLVPGRK